MRPGHETDVRIAKEVFGYEVWAKGDIFYENPAQGERPLAAYSSEMQWAQAVLEKMKMTVIPILGDQWFVFVGPEDRTGWESPQAVFQFLESGNFSGCGAASGSNLPALICEAALKAVEKRATEKMAIAEASATPLPTKNNVTPIH